MRMLRRSRDLPFSAEALDGWRAWSLVERDGDVWLSSLTRAEQWAPGEPFVAVCSRRRHASPGRACSCGVYAAGNPEELAGLGRIAGAAIGQVSLWGRIAEHSRGYRAEIAYPARLRLVCVACFAEGEGVPATRIDRVTPPPRTRLVPLCDDHAGGRSLPPASEVEQRLLERYQVEPVPDATVERIRRDPRIAIAEQRSRRLVLAMVVAMLSLLAVVALVGELTTGRQTSRAAVPASVAPAIGDDSIKLPHDRISTGLASSPRIRILLLSPRPFIAPKCGRVTSTSVVPTECGDPRADVFVDNVGSVGPRREGACGEETTVITRRGDRVMCWRPLPDA